MRAIVTSASGYDYRPANTAPVQEPAALLMLGGGLFTLCRRLRTRRQISLGALVTAFSFCACLESQAQIVVTPNTSPPPLQNLQTITIDASAGAHFDPHVDGALISYTTNLFDGTGTHIRFYRVGVDSSPQQIPFGANEQDFLSDAAGTRIAYDHVDNNGSHIYLLDTAQPAGSSNPLEINPVAQAGCSISNGDCFNRFSAAIRGNTIAYIDMSRVTASNRTLAMRTRHSPTITKP